MNGDIALTMGQIRENSKKHNNKFIIWKKKNEIPKTKITTAIAIIILW